MQTLSPLPQNKPKLMNKQQKEESSVTFWVRFLMMFLTPEVYNKIM